MSELMREQFEAAVIARFKESGFLEVEIRVECLARSVHGYQDESVAAYWKFWKASRAALVVQLPQITATEVGRDAHGEVETKDFYNVADVAQALAAAGVNAK